LRILFDENVPAPLRQFFADDQVATVQQLGWSGIENGELVSRAEADFDVLILADKNLRYQQNLAGRTLALVELPTNRWPVLEQLGIQVADAAHGASVGSYVVVQKQ
jgi:predicted nuclease of predicted toxin-antitoxin system